MPEGIEVTLIKNPMYDSLKYCKREHPLYPGKPIDSSRFTFLDFGKSKANNEYGNNIMMLREKDTFSHGWVGGTWTPTGPIRGGQATALIDGYEMWVKGSAGVCYKDVTRGGELIYDNDF